MKSFSNQRGIGIVVVIVAIAILAAGGIGGYMLFKDKETTTPQSASESQSASDEDNIRDVVITYYQALGAKDYKTACEQLNTAAQAEAGRLFNTGTCQASVERSLSTTSEADLAKLRAAKINSVQVQGTTATVQVEGATKPIPMEKAGSDWKIARFNN